MRNFVVAACLVLGACAFEPGAEPEGMGDGSGGGSDMGSGSGSGSGSGTPIVNPTVACSFTDPSLRLCLEFEDRKFDPMVTDASLGRLDSTATDVNATDRSGKTAAAFAWGSKIDVPESPKLDVTGPLTIEMWVWPAYPHSVNLLENANQYRIQLAGDGRIGCAQSNSQVWSTTTVGLGWTHIACVYDGEDLSVYINGARSEHASGAPASGSGVTGTQIGRYYAGALDDIRIYASSLTSGQVCTHAGRTSCPSADD